MKISLTRKAKQLASSLLTALVICSILSLVVMYYLSLIEQQNVLSARSQTWNMAIAVSEAGVEEGLQHLNDAYPDLGNDGWSFDGSTSYYKTNALVDGNSYSSSIYITHANNPTIIARAFVTPPVATYWQSTAMILFATTAQTPDLPATINRAVQVKCNKTTPYNGALIAKKNINLNGNNVATDSFDSSDNTKSVNGQYNASFYRGSKGDIATNLGVISSIAGGNANVYGHAHTGLGSQANSLQIGPNGYVGSLTDYPALGSGVDPGWWTGDANFTFPDTSYPNTSSYLTPTNGWVTNITVTITTNTTYMPLQPSPPLPGTYTSYTTTKIAGETYYNVNLINTINPYTTNSVSTGTYYDNILWGNNSTTNCYVASSLSGSTLVMGSNVVLALPNGLNMSGNDAFQIGPNSGVTVYSGGTTAAINGNSFVNNPGYAADFVMFCAPTVTSLAFNGNSTFDGVIVAPNADVTLNGGGTSMNFSGSLMASSITLNGHFNFHYDEALSRLPGFGRFLILTWNEVN